MKKKILFIDDDSTILMISEIMIKNLGYDVLTANGGRTALDALKKHNSSIDIIFLDLMMPDIYGIDVLQHIKDDENLKDIPVIIQTGVNDKAEVDKALKMGAKAVLYKPYDKEELKKALEELD